MAHALKQAQLRVLEQNQQHQQKQQVQKQKQQQDKPKVPIQHHGGNLVKIQRAVLSAAAANKKANGPKPIASYIKSILDILMHDPHKGHTPSEILDKVEVESSSRENLLKELRLNPFVRFEDGLFYYKSKYNLKSKEELLAKIYENSEGIDYENLKDAYRDVEKDINELVDSNSIYRIQNSENKHNILYPCDDRFTIKIFPEFQALWSQVRIPDEVDLENEMNEAGLTMMEREKKTNKRPAAKSKKQSQRRVKLTNIHLKDIDLTKDFVPPDMAKGAFSGK